jgi:hypothetical protein
MKKKLINKVSEHINKQFLIKLMLLSKNIFCAWILKELRFFIPTEIIISIVSQIKFKTKIINDRRNLLIIYDKSIGVFDPITNKFNFKQIDWIKNVFSNFGTTHVITTANEICKFESRKLDIRQAKEYINNHDKDKDMYDFFKKHAVTGVKKCIVDGVI